MINSCNFFDNPAFNIFTLDKIAEGKYLRSSNSK